MTTANESKLGGARGGHRGPIVLRVAAARVLPLLPVAARGARLVLSMGLAAGCVRARSSSSHCVCVCGAARHLNVDRELSGVVVELNRASCSSGEL